MSEDTQFIRQWLRSDSNAAVGSVVGQTENDDPERAARALELSKATDIPAEAIYPNLDQFETQHKAVLNSDVIAGNPHLQDYLNSSPMAPKVSADDIGPLDEGIRAVRDFVGGATSATAKSYLAGDNKYQKAFWEGFGDQPIGSWVVNPKATTQPNPWATAVAGAAGAIPELAFRTVSGMIHSVQQEAYDLISSGGKAVGLNGELLARDIAGMIEAEATGMTGRHGIPSPEGVQLAKGAIAAIEPYLVAGKEPPMGVHPLIDSIKKAEAQLDAKALDDAVKSMEATATKQRDPDHAVKSIESASEGRSIHVEADAIRNLYGGKEPEPEDGLLGDIITSDQLEAAGPGGYVTVPVKDWAARIDPDIHKELRDNIVFRDGGASLEELAEPAKVEEKAEVEDADDTRPEALKPIDTVRQAGGLEPMLSLEDAVVPTTEGPEPITIRVPFKNGKAIGITQALYKKLLDLSQKQHEADLAYDFKKAEQAEKQSQTREWKTNRTKMRDQVREEIEQRPAVMLDKAMAADKIKFHPDKIADEQKALLPKEYMQKKDGIDPDLIAPSLGYPTGADLINHLAAIAADRVQSGKTPRQYLNDLIDAETDRRMEAQYGSLRQNVLEEAKDRALSQNQIDILATETLVAGEQAKATLPFDREVIDSTERAKFDQIPIKRVNSEMNWKAMRLASNRALEAALKGDFQESFKLKQTQYVHALQARFAMDYEAQRAKFDKMVKRLSKKEPPDIEPTWVNWIHHIMKNSGLSVNRSGDHIAESIGRASEKTLEDFINARENETYGVGPVPVADFLVDGDFKDLNDMTAWEFTGLNNSLKTLSKLGRDVYSVRTEGETMAKVELRDKLIAQLKTFPKKKLSVNEEGRKSLPRSWLAGSTAIETLMNRWDRDNPYGLFNRFIVYPLASAANYESKLIREHSRRYGEAAGKLEDPDKPLPSPFIDPHTRTPHTPEGVPMEGFNRRRGMAVLYNLGNESNLKVLAGGYAVDREELMEWARTHMTEEDWDRAQRVWDFYRPIINEADDVYERLTGWPVEKIPLKPIKGPGGKMYRGGYYPLVAHPNYKTVWKKDAETGQWIQRDAAPVKDIYSNDDFFHGSTANGYTMRRTGKIYPLSLNPDMAPIRATQMIHDIAFREVVKETHKIFSSQIFLDAVRQHYGPVYADLLKPYLEAVAGSRSINAGAMEDLARWSEFARANVLSTYIGFNPTTPMKHGPTAFVMSSRQVGAQAFAKATYEAWFQAPSLASKRREFALENSEELQRRERHWLDSFAGQQEIINDQMGARGKVAYYGSKAVAFSDKFSAIPTWLARYDKALAETGGDKRLSIEVADAAVRKAHGSTALTNKPALVRGEGALHNWLTSVYGFFGTVMQRRIEIAHKAADAYDLGVKQGEWNAARKKAAQVAYDILAYVVWPTYVEEQVTGMFTEDKKGLGEHLLYGTLMGMASGALYLRDIVHGLATGRPPGAGLLQGPLGDIGNVMNDARKVIDGRGAFDAQHAGTTVAHALTLAGDATGLMPKTFANAAKFGIDLYNDTARPEGYDEWLRGLVRGKPKKVMEH